MYYGVNVFMTRFTITPKHNNTKTQQKNEET